MQRLRDRTNNPYGKCTAERAEIARHVETIDRSYGWARRSSLTDDAPSSSSLMPSSALYQGPDPAGVGCFLFGGRTQGSAFETKPTSSDSLHRNEVTASPGQSSRQR
jgi:hypothetical protein